ACRIVHGLLTSGCTSGKRCRSSKVGCQVRPRGGPNSAHVFSPFARSVVVNFASTEWNAAIGGVRNPPFPHSSSILPLQRSSSPSQFLSRSDGRQTVLPGRPSVVASVSRRTSRSFVLLQPQ